MKAGNVADRLPCFCDVIDEEGTDWCHVCRHWESGKKLDFSRRICKGKLKEKSLKFLTS